MADTNFVDASATIPGTTIVASWLNDVNTNTYAIVGGIGGAPNAITGTGPLTVTVAYPRGVAFRFIPTANNTGATTINISGLGVRNITKQGANPLQAGDLVAGSWAYVAYDNVQFQLINPQGPLDATDTYVTTAGTSVAYTLPVVGNFTRFTGNAVKMIFHATNTSTTPTLDVDGTGAAAIKVMSTLGTKIDPIVGAFATNIPATAVWDGTNWLVAPEYPSGRLLNVQTFFASGTYTPTPGTTRIHVKGIGAGAGGGGAIATGAATVSVGSGGGAGGYGETLLTSGFLPTVAVVIGATGIGVLGAAGTSGGASTFGAFLTVNGGTGGGVSAAAASTFASGSAGGTSTVGNILNVTGSSSPSVLAASSLTLMLGGEGVASVFGGCPTTSVASTGNGNFGSNATALGAGGSGAVNGFSQTTRSGGNGGGAAFFVYEYS